MKTIVAVVGVLVIFALLASAIALVPSFAFAQAPLVQCGNDGQETCTFGDFYTLVNRLISFGLFWLAIPLATISLAIAGFLFLTSGGNDSQRTKAKGIILWALVGLALALAAWLIVNTIVKGLVDEGRQGKIPLEQIKN